jgi:hypothetical protein
MYTPVGFRVIHDGNGVDIFPSAGFDDEGNLTSREPFMLWNNTAVFDDHLAWQKRPTPFASFFSHWGRAMRRQNWLHARGCRNVHIVAFNERRITLQSSSHTVNVMVPAVFTSGLERGRETNELRIQIYQYTGVFDEGRLDMLVRHMGGLV